MEASPNNVIASQAQRSAFHLLINLETVPVGRDWKQYVLHYADTLVCFQSANTKPILHVAG